MGVWRGLKIPLYIGQRAVWGVPVLSPVQVARGGGDDPRNSSYMLLEHDLRLACHTLRDDPPPPAWNPEAIASRVEVIPRLGAELSHFLSAPAIGIDLETDSLTPWKCKYGILSCAISDGNRTIAFPLHHPQAPSPENRKRLLAFLQDYRGKAVAHNAGFEMLWLFAEYGPEVVLNSIEWHDSMAGQRVLLNRESPMGLDEGALLWLGRRFKNITNVDAKKYYLYTVDQLLTYNGLDAAACLMLARSQGLFELAGNQGLEYRRLREAITATTLMGHAGIPLDAKKCVELERPVYEKIREETQIINAMPDVIEWSRKKGKPFTPTSPDQVADFFESINLLSPGQGTAESVLRDVPHPAAHRILEIRRQERLISTYLGSWPKVMGKDGLLHPRYTVLLVATGRLSSEDPNIQNVPKRKDKWIRQCIPAPPGMSVLALDYSQLEIRILAMMCKDVTLLQELWSGTDLHWGWTNRTIELYPEVLDRIAQEYSLNDDAKIRKTLRDEIKRGLTFALPYGSSRNTPAQILQLPQEVGHQLADEHRRHYPGIYKWQEDMRRFYRDHGYVEIFSTQRRRSGLLEGNEPLNTPIQGTASDLVVAAMIRLAKRAKEDLCFLPRINIHDDLTFFVPTSQVESYAAEIGKEMVKVVHPMIIVPITVEASHGPNWYDQTTLAEYKSTDYGHRRPRGRQTAVSEVSPDALFGGSWSGFRSFSHLEAAGEPDVPSRVVVRRPFRGR